MEKIKIPVSVSLSYSLLEKLNKVAAKKEISRSELVCNIIKDYLKLENN